MTPAARKKQAEPTNEGAEARRPADAEAAKRGGDGDANPEAASLGAPPQDEATIRVRVKPSSADSVRRVYEARAFVRGEVVTAVEGLNRHAAFGGAAAGLVYYWQVRGVSAPPTDQDPPTP